MKRSVTRQLLLDEAARRGWPTKRVGDLLEIKAPNGVINFFQGSRPMNSAANGAHIAAQKVLTMRILEHWGYKLPAFAECTNQFDAEGFLHQYKTVVVKPVDGDKSQGVTTSITTMAGYAAALKLAIPMSKSGRAMCQQQLYGNLYRILVVDNNCVAASWRKAATVYGDGENTVRELVDITNQNPLRGEASDPMVKIKIEDVKEYIGAHRLDEVLPRGQALRIASIDSVSAGGSAHDVTDMVHPLWQKIVVDISRRANLIICGVDIICKDIALPPPSEVLPLLEINSMPGLKIHHYPAEGTSRDVATLLFDAVFKV